MIMPARLLSGAGDMACAGVAMAKAKAAAINLIILFSMCSFLQDLAPSSYPGLNVLGMKLDVGRD